MVKAVPLQARMGPESSRKLRFPDFVIMAQDGGKVVSLTHRPPLPPRKYCWYSFLLEAESTPGSYCDRKDFMSTTNSSDIIWDFFFKLMCIYSDSRVHLYDVQYNLIQVQPVGLFLKKKIYCTENQ